MLYIINSEQLAQLIKNGIKYAQDSPALDAEHQKWIFAQYQKYFDQNGFPKVQFNDKGKPRPVPDDTKKQQAEDIRQFIKEELNKMVQFNKAKAMESQNLPVGKQEVAVSKAEFRYSKTNKPMIMVSLRGKVGFGNLFIVQSDWSDNQIESLLSSADSLGCQIPTNIDFQLNEQFAGFINQYIKKLYVSVKEDENSDFPRINTVRKPEPKGTQNGQASAPNPFEQSNVQTTPQANPFGRNEQYNNPNIQGNGAQGSTGQANQLPPTFGQDAGGFPPNVNPADLPFDTTGMGQL